MTSSKFVVVDGIKVLREDYDAFTRAEEEYKQKKRNWREEDDDEEFLEAQLEQDESPEYAKRFPKRCHGTCFNQSL